MPSLAPAAHFSKVFSEYLASTAALTYGAPTLDSVQRRHLTSTAPIRNPNLLIECDAAPDGTDEFLMLTIKLVLTVQLGTESGQTTAAQAETWFKTFRALLSPDPDAYAAWDIWIGTLSDADKAGWYAQNFIPQATESDENKETNLLTLTAPFQVTSFWSN
jgi:hypothetical protein